VVVVGLLTTGCVAQVRTVRRQAPMIALGSGGHVALASVEVPKWVLDRAPAEYGHPSAMLVPALQRAFDGLGVNLVDRRDLGWSMTIGPRSLDTGALMVVDPKAAPLDEPEQVFIASPPAHLPLGMIEPLILGVQVIGWTFRKETVGQSIRMRAETDLVYSLWTRDGREVETRRVRLAMVPSAGWKDAPHFVPARSHWWSWSNSKTYWMKRAGLREDQTFGEAVSANAQAYFFPFHPAEFHFGRQLDDSDEALKPGIELIKQDKVEEAFASWDEAARERPQLAGAFYNMGIAMEIQGHDDEAIALFRKALKAKPNTGLYSRELEAVESRQRARIEVILPPPATPVF